VASGTPVNVRIKFTIVEKDVTKSIVSSLGTVNYPNTIVIREQYEIEVGPNNWVSLDTQIGYFIDYYSRDKGWILDEYVDELGAPGGKMEARRLVVF